MVPKAKKVKSHTPSLKKPYLGNYFSNIFNHQQHQHDDTMSFNNNNVSFLTVSSQFHFLLSFITEAYFRFFLIQILRQDTVGSKLHEKASFNLTCYMQTLYVSSVGNKWATRPLAVKVCFRSCRSENKIEEVLCYFILIDEGFAFIAAQPIFVEIKSS